MKKNTALLAACLLCILVAAGIAYRINGLRDRFDQTVRESLRTSEGYDQKFIDMVNQMERVLAERASFGYLGGKDPMTGKMRVVAAPPPPKDAKPGKGDSAAVDPFKLTAIIAGDQGKQYTAIVMDGDRSYSVAVGDRVGDRKILEITNERIYLESDSLYYYYDIFGNKGEKPRK